MALVLTNSENIASQSSKRHRAYRHWVAWMALCGALAVHVADEALTDFLALYNPTVLSIRERYPLLPLPIFTFESWLSLLVFVIVVLMAVSYFVWKGRWAMRPISYAFAGFMLLNGLLHIAGSLYTATFMPGVYSSPLLIAASIVLIVRTRAHSRAQR